MKSTNIGRDMLIGLTVADALGVPVEFKSKLEMQMFPLTDMIGFGSHHQPPGTWSDDSSLTFCLAEELLAGFDLHKIGQSFRRWYYENHWTPHGEVFDIGGTTLDAIERLGIPGMAPELAGGFEEHNNGNGSLMRILPLALHLKDKDIDERYKKAQQVSSITHGHFRSVMACFIYIELALELMEGKAIKEAQQATIKRINSFVKGKDFSPSEMQLFQKALDKNLDRQLEMNMRGSGYVLHSLESSIWCLLTTQSYEAAVLKAINLGEDTDTTGAITGGLAGILYGWEAIPSQWVDQLARKEDVLELADKLTATFT